jgi:YHS domain-containing protein
VVVDPEFGLLHMQMALWDPVDPEQLGSLDPELQTLVNGEIYRFGSRRTLRMFQRDPVRWCGLLRDPVSAVRFVPRPGCPRCEWNGSPYYFTSDSTMRVFLTAPWTYEVRRNL